MSVGGIDKTQINAMLAQIRAAQAKTDIGASMANATPVKGGGDVLPTSAANKTAAPQKLDFAETLKSSIQQVSDTQQASQELGKRFALGDDNVSLSDVMISMQKSSLAFQTTVQVRNKLVSAYHDIMNMQI